MEKNKNIFKEDNIDFDLIKKYLKDGKTIVYPTDTVYGFGASIDSIVGISKIYSLKRRDLNLPLIALIDKAENIGKVAYIYKSQKKLIEFLIKNYWPGPLTLILNKKESVPELMVSGGKTVGVRVPNLKLARDIIEACGGVLATTSANISGEKSPKTFNDISEEFKEKVDIIIEEKDSGSGLESTIIDLTKERPVVIREGAIKTEDIDRLIKKYEIGGKNESTEDKS